MSVQLQFPEPVERTVNPAAGQRAKQQGMARAAENTPVAWATACDRAIQEMARRGQPFQASDLIREGLVDEPPHPNQWGPRFTHAAHKGWIVEAGTAKSNRTKTRRSRLCQWIGAHAATAEGRAAA